MPHRLTNPYLLAMSSATGAASVNAWLLEADPFLSLGLAVIAAIFGVASKHLRSNEPMTWRDTLGRYLVGVMIGVMVYVFLEETTAKRAYLIAMTWLIAYTAEAILPRVEKAAVRMAVKIFDDPKREGKSDE